MRRLLVIVSAVVMVDTVLYAALTPLLPEYSDEFGLSKTSAGVLLALYAVGVLVGAFPAGVVAARFGAKRAALTGLLVVGGASVAFAFAGDAATLGAARFAQGLGSALSWSGGLAWLVAATPRERRGELLGAALGAAIFGALLGPVVGGIASVAGSRVTFSAVGVVAVLIALVALRQPGVERERPSLAAVSRALGERRFVGGVWLILLPALLFGLLNVLVALDLDRLGWGALAIGSVFFVAAALEAVTSPLMGRVADRRGALAPIRMALPVAVALSLALAWADEPELIAALVFAAALAYGTLFAPGMTLLSDGAERAGLPQGLAFGIMNAGWATGATLGPAAGGAVGEAAGDPVAYGLGAFACLATLLALPGHPALGTLRVRVPGTR